jgi:peptide/nickel transport system permease protein
VVARIIVRRLLLLPPMLLLISFVSFGLIVLMPGDPARLVAGDFATAAQVAHIRKQLGLSQPFFVRYYHYLTGIFHGNLGTSLAAQKPVGTLIGQYLPNSLELVVMSLVLATVVGLFLGIVSAYWHQRRADKTVRGVVTVMQAIPDFVFALLFIYIFYFVLRVVPAPIGRLPAGASGPKSVTGFLIVDSVITGNLHTLGQALAHSVLPVAALGLALSVSFAKVSRAALIPAFSSAQVEFARACGLPERTVIRYAWLAARTPILTNGAILLSVLLGGTAIVETIFSWNGFGQWAVQSVLVLDVPAIQGFILVVGAGTLLVYLALDTLTALLDPRIST